MIQIKTHQILLFIALFFGALAFVDSRESSAALHGRQIIASGPFTCESEQNSLIWRNDTGSALQIRQAQIWIGMFEGARADIHFWLALDDGNLIGHTNWDHYADPTQPHMIHYRFSPDYILLQPEQAIELHYGCVALREENAVGDLAVTLWWRE